MHRRFNLRLIFLLVLLLLAAARQISKDDRPSLLRPGLHLYAYVTNAGDGSLRAGSGFSTARRGGLATGGTVTVVDLAALQTQATIPVGPSPSGIRAHPTREEIWGVSTAGGFVWIIDARANQVAARISLGSARDGDVGAQPFAVDFSPDGKRAYVAASGSGSVVAIDCARREVVGRARVGRRPWIARATPDGKLLVVANRDDNTVTLLNAASLEPVATIPVAPRPEQVVVLPDSRKAFVVSQNSELRKQTAETAPQVSIVDLQNPGLIANLPLPATAADLVLEPKDGKLLVPSPESHGLTIIDTWRNEVEQFLLVGSGPARGVLSASPKAPDDLVLYLTDADAGHVIPVQLRFRRALRPIQAGRRPGVCRVTPGEDLLLVVNEDSDDLAVIRTRTQSLITMVPVGSHPTDLTVKVF